MACSGTDKRGKVGLGGVGSGTVSPGRVRFGRNYKGIGHFPYEKGAPSLEVGCGAVWRGFVRTCLSSFAAIPIFIQPHDSI